MNCLLDTHIFLWYIDNNEKLPGRYAEIIQNPENNIYLSPVSIWEILIKTGQNKIKIEEPAIEFIKNQCGLHRIDIIVLELNDLKEYEKLPGHHKDPFDRLLINQSINRKLYFITDDSYNLKYSILRV